MIQDGPLTRATPTATKPAAAHLSRDLVLSATARVLAESGYDATTIRRIAAELDCAVGSIYRYFTDKRELLLAVTQQAFEPLAAALESGADLETSIREYHRLASGDRCAYELMFWLWTVGDPPSRDQGTSALPPVVGRIVDLWAAGMGDPVRAGKCWALLHASIITGQSAQAALAVAASSMPVIRPLPAGHTDHAAPPTLAQAVAVNVPREQPPAFSSNSMEDVCLL